IKLLADRREQRTARFAREVDLLAELSHPGIVRYVSHGTTPAGQRFLVMEWLDGEDLKARLDRAPLTVGEAVELATRVAEALGCVLFQCLTGSPAFDGDTAIAILGKVLFGEAPRLRAVWPDAPEDLDALLARMLARDPALRPSDGANLAAALAALGPAVHAA